MRTRRTSGLQLSEHVIYHHTEPAVSTEDCYLRCYYRGRHARIRPASSAAKCDSQFRTENPAGRASSSRVDCLDTIHTLQCTAAALRSPISDEQCRTIREKHTSPLFSIVLCYFVYSFIALQCGRGTCALRHQWFFQFHFYFTNQSTNE